MPRKGSTLKRFSVGAPLVLRGTRTGSMHSTDTHGRPVNSGRPTFLNVGDLPAKVTPVNRGSRAMRRRSIRFTMPTSWQFLLLEVPAVRRAFLFERRLLIVNAARALVESHVLSLNAAARLFGIAPSILCVLIQRHRAGGDESLLPRVGAHGPSSACHLSLMMRVR